MAKHQDDSLPKEKELVTKYVLYAIVINIVYTL